MLESQPDPGFMGVIPWLLIIGFVWVFIVPAIRRKKSVLRLPSLEQYLAQHPKCQSGKQVTCYACGGNSIYLWWLYGPQVGQGPKKHICRTCGKELWHSL
jgi:hypothetical protein